MIELNRRGWLPAGTLPGLTANHPGAIYVAFTLLLFVEVVGLVFALARSVADSVGKQFELLSLILLRKAFLEFAELPEPIRWEDVAPAIPHMAADIDGALLIFVVLGFYYRVQRHLPMSCWWRCAKARATRWSSATPASRRCWTDRAAGGLTVRHLVAATQAAAATTRAMAAAYPASILASVGLW